MDGSELTGVFLDDRGGEVLFVTFSHRNWTPTDGKEYWGKEPLAKLGVSTLGLIAKERHWYPEDDTRSLLDRIARTGLFKGRRIITYGISMGGYGAIKYASQIGADVSLAVVPQWSIDPAEVAQADPRYVSSFSAERNAGMRVVAADMAPETHIIYDPLFSKDRFHVRRLQETGAVIRPILATGQGHSPGFVLAEGRQGTAMLRAYAEGSANPHRAARNALRRARRNSPTYFQAAAKTLVRQSPSHVPTALRYLDEALRLAPDVARTYCQKAACLMLVGRFEDAEIALTRGEPHASRTVRERIALQRQRLDQKRKSNVNDVAPA